MARAFWRQSETYEIDSASLLSTVFSTADFLATARFEAGLADSSLATEALTVEGLALEDLAAEGLAAAGLAASVFVFVPVSTSLPVSGFCPTVIETRFWGAFLAGIRLTGADALAEASTFFSACCNNCWFAFFWQQCSLQLPERITQAVRIETGIRHHTPATGYADRYTAIIAKYDME